jgi:hypothetical protein
MPIDPCFTAGFKKPVHHEHDEAWARFMALPEKEQSSLYDFWWRKYLKKERLTPEEYTCWSRAKVRNMCRKRVARFARREFYSGGGFAKVNKHCNASSAPFSTIGSGGTSRQHHSFKSK